MICSTCCKGNLSKKNIKGRYFKWKNTYDVLLEVDFECRVCDSCDDFFINRKQAVHLDEVIESSLKAHIAR